MESLKLRGSIQDEIFQINLQEAENSSQHNETFGGSNRHNGKDSLFSFKQKEDDPIDNEEKTTLDSIDALNAFDQTFN